MNVSYFCNSRMMRLCQLSLATLFAVFLTAPAMAQLVINEIDYDQPGTDTAEFLEIKNVSGAAVDLDLYDVILVNGSNGSVYQTVNLPSVSLSAGNYYVLCEDANTVANCDLDILNSIQNGGPDAVAIFQGAAVIDTVSYEGDTVAPYTETSGSGLIDIGSSGFEFSGIARFPDGADTDVNNVDLSPRCITPGAANTSASSDCTEPEAEKVVINEIDYDQGVTDDAEFIELYNSGNLNVTLSDLQIRLINGTNGAVNKIIPLTGGVFEPGSYFVICFDIINTQNCSSDGMLLAAEDIDDGVPSAVALFKSGILIDTISYGGNSIAPYTEGTGTGIDDPAEVLAGLSRFPNGADSDTNSTDVSQRCITPGGPNTIVSSGCTGGTSQEIFAIQGTGLASPADGQVVTTNDNIVTAVGAAGFFMQTPTFRSDGDPETSDGIYVFTSAAPTVLVGDQVDVTGLIDEFFDLTEFTNSPLVSVDSSGNPLPAPVTLNTLTPSPDQPQPANEMERYEGMLVSFSGTASGPADQFGDAPVVAGTERPFREPGITFPGLPGLPVFDGNPQIFEINPNGVGLPDELIFGSQTMTATGPLTYSFGDYSVWPTSLSLDPIPAFPRAVRAGQPGELTVATYNVLRFFDTEDDPLTDDPVSSQAEFDARLEKYANYIRVTLAAPDIVALQEVENMTALQAIADKIAADEPGLDYSAWLIEGNDVGGIDLGYLTLDDTISVNQVTRFGENSVLDFDGSLLHDRPPLVLDAVYTGGSSDFPVTVINLHQRSLGGIEGSEATRVKTKRLEQAQEVASMVQSLQVNDPAINLIVAGDFNAYEFTDGYVDVEGQISGSLDPLGAEFAGTDIVNPDLRNHVLDLAPEERYSFIFSGSAQALDYIMSSIALQPSFVEAAFARGNVDAPRNLLLETGPNLGLRVSDHDAMVVYYMTGAGSDSDFDLVPDDVDNCTNVANADQIDADDDGHGNVCDADFNQSCFVNFDDLNLMKIGFFSPDPLLDLDGSGFVNFDDLGIMKNLFFQAPGPSASGSLCNP